MIEHSVSVYMPTRSLLAEALSTFFFPPLLIPPCLSGVAGYLFPSFGRELFGAGFPTLLSSEPAEFLSGFVLFLTRPIILS